MELNVVSLVALSIFFAFHLAHSTCLRTDIIPSHSLYHGSRQEGVQLSTTLPVAPRKLKLAKVDDKTRSAAALQSHNDQGKTMLVADKSYHKEEGIEEKVEETMSDFIAMDYDHAKKRCPSHNQSPPAAP